MDMVVLGVLLIYVILAGFVLLIAGCITDQFGELETFYGIFWPITLLVGLVWIFTTGIHIFIRGIKSWNWHENS